MANISSEYDIVESDEISGSVPPSSMTGHVYRKHIDGSCGGYVVNRYGFAGDLGTKIDSDYLAGNEPKRRNDSNRIDRPNDRFDCSPGEMKESEHTPAPPPKTYEYSSPAEAAADKIVSSFKAFVKILPSMKDLAENTPTAADVNFVSREFFSAIGYIAGGMNNIDDRS